MSPIPKTAPFAEEEIDLLNRVVGTASPVQRAWLAGFLAGLDASGAAVMPHPAAPARPAEPLTIVYEANPEIPKSSPATSPKPRARTG